ncbi:FMN-dependent dehydrogenase [Myriangium duriaei CBS 260.36]|uniref:Oxidase FUB9 n=1 Tax=Myriangium duriaei CBS 260.36 TaxID=1168546 RepID=A0A9P4JAJ7_9PEZI|nr:FMN-dependent dehydrogenase [Myriangium duriaei CBS 260.36]
MANRAASWDDHVFSIADLNEKGSAKLPPMYREYYNHGAMDMITLQDNEEAFNRYKIRPRILRNVSNIDTSATICGEKSKFPLALAPVAMQRLAHPDGEVACSRAAAKMGVPMCLSSYSTSSLEDVKAQGSTNAYMVQMCIVRDRSVTLQLLERAEKAGYKALFLSVDVPVLGIRLNEARNKFQLPDSLKFPNIVSEFGDKDDRMAYDDTIEWDELLEWLRGHTKMEIWFKGVTSPEDVEKAVSYGVDGVIISNHGGRQLDGVPSTLDALRQCAPSAKGKIRIGMDGGIRRGTDIFKAIALGAEFVLLGRATIWGLAYKGQAGVELALQILLAEFKTTMALAGCRAVSDISVNHLSVLGVNGILAKL